MTGYEIRERLASELRPEHRFVRWWRRENDFLDYDLAERFRDSLSGAEEIGGVDLLTRDERWQELQRVSAKRVSVQHSSTRGTVIEWVHRDATGSSSELLPYTDEAILDIFDAETRDNPID